MLDVVAAGTFVECFANVGTYGPFGEGADGDPELDQSLGTRVEGPAASVACPSWSSAVATVGNRSRKST